MRGSPARGGLRAVGCSELGEENFCGTLERRILSAMALMPNPQQEPVSAFVHLPATDKPLTVSRCLSCGLIVAAASDRRILQLAEQLHHCPVYFNYLPQAS